MLTLLVVFFVMLTISAHELGHAIAMRERGIPIEIISLLGIPGLATWHLPIRSTWFPGTKWVMHPIIIGAYVKPDADALQRASARDVIYISAMGPIMNIVIGVPLVAIARLSMHIDAGALSLPAVGISVGVCGATYLLWVFRDWLARWIFPVLTIIVLGIAIWSIVRANPFESMAGPVGLVDIIRLNATPSAAMMESASRVGIEYLSLWNAMHMVGVVSIIIGLSNLLPFLPFDGGHILRAMLSERWHALHHRVSWTGFLSLIALALASDAWRMIKYMS